MSSYLMAKYGLPVIICLLFFTIRGVAQDSTHQVKAGETLFSIARQYNITVQKLKEWNKLSANELRIGQTLTVKSSGEKKRSIHTVDTQETLFSLSKKYGVTIAEIKSWNNLKDNNLSVGQTLIIYPRTGDSGKDRSAASSLVEGNITQQNTYYTVKSGDNLFNIARAHNMTITQLKKLNNLSSNNIRVGQQLTVRATSSPPSVSDPTAKSSPQGKFINYTVEGTRTLQEILRKFQMDREEFRALNPDISSATFRNGQKVTVLAPPSRSYANPYHTQANLKSLGQTKVTKYGESEKAKTTTSGELYNPKELTAAHSNIALGTIIFIQNTQNQQGIYVRINDRTSSGGLKLSEAAWEALDISAAKPSVKIFID